MGYFTFFLEVEEIYLGWYPKYNFVQIKGGVADSNIYINSIYWWQTPIYTLIVVRIYDSIRISIYNSIFS